MRTFTLLISLVLLGSSTVATAAVNTASDAYKMGSKFGYVLLGGMALLVLIGYLKKKGILGSKKADTPQRKAWKPTPWLITWASLFLLLAAYILSYVPRRSDGSYRATESGALRTDRGFALDDVQQWSPVGCWWQHAYKNADGTYRSKGNKLGYFYAPLISIDRRFSFPDKRINRIAATPSSPIETARR